MKTGKAHFLRLLKNGCGKGIVLVYLGGASWNCGTGNNAASALLSSPTYPGGGQAKCKIRSSALEPLVVEWESADRAKLEAMAQQGVVAVRYNGCEMQILAGCHGPKVYKYQGTTLKEDHVKITTADELYAKLPFGAIKLESTLEKSGSLEVDMAIVGRLQALRYSVTAKDLHGRCEGATHAVTALTVGAFGFLTGAKAKVGGGVSIAGSGPFVDSAAERTSLKKDGDPGRCKDAGPSDLTYPPGCGAIIRLEVTPLPEVEAALRSQQDRAENEYLSKARTASNWRLAGWIVGGSGLALGGLGGYFAYRSGAQNDLIKEGGFNTSADIVDARDTGKTFDQLGWGLGITGGVLALTGTAFILLNPAPEKPPNLVQWQPPLTPTFRGNMGGAMMQRAGGVRAVERAEQNQCLVKEGTP